MLLKEIWIALVSSEGGLNFGGGGREEGLKRIANYFFGPKHKWERIPGHMVAGRPEGAPFGQPVGWRPSMEVTIYPSPVPTYRPKTGKHPTILRLVRNVIT